MKQLYTFMLIEHGLVVYMHSGQEFKDCSIQAESVLAVLSAIRIENLVVAIVPDKNEGFAI